jgi:hypothetical protein
MAKARDNSPSNPNANVASAPVGDPIVVHAVITSESDAKTAERSSNYPAIALIVDALKALAWPLLALMFFLTFQDAIRRTIVLVPDKLEKADKVNIASLSWEIQQRAREEGGPELARRVGTLSVGAVKELLAAPRNGIQGVVSGYSDSNGKRGFSVPPNDRFDGLRELESAQLVKFTESLKTWLPFVRSLLAMQSNGEQLPDGSRIVWPESLTAVQRERLDRQNYELTPKGRQALEAIVETIGEQLASR